MSTEIIISQGISETIISSNSFSTSIGNPSIGTTILELVAQGPQGTSGEIIIERLADGPIGGHRVVKITPTGCDYADSSNISDLGKVIGMTDSAFSANTNVKIFTQKEITEPSWAWTLGPVYLSTNGLLTQIIPTTGFIQQVGIALSSTKLLLSLQPPIKL